MNANELRIGNLVYKSLKSGQGRTVINPIGCQDIVRIFEDIGSFNYAPIPLTEDILLKCGFVKGVLWSEMRIHSNLRFYSDFDETVCHLFDRSDNNLAECKYLHQLQNLFFCLCGKELTIKL